MKIWATMFVAAAVTVPLAAQPAVPKLGVIDVQRLVVESAPGKEAQARVKKLIEAKQGDADKLQKELQALQQRLQTQGPSLTDDKREQLNKEIQDKSIAFKRFQDDAQRDVEAAQQKELQALEKRVLPVINLVGKEQGYTLIFNKYAPGMLVYADDSVDITEEVLRRFNTQVTVPPPAKPAAKPSEKKPGGR
jgi:outer membrane protein